MQRNGGLCKSMSNLHPRKTHARTQKEKKDPQKTPSRRRRILPTDTHEFKVKFSLLFFFGLFRTPPQPPGRNPRCQSSCDKNKSYVKHTHRSMLQSRDTRLLRIPSPIETPTYLEFCLHSSCPLILLSLLKNLHQLLPTEFRYRYLYLAFLYQVQNTRT